MLNEENTSFIGESNLSIGEQTHLLGVERRRWIILLISCTAIFLRGFNQSCYGPINSVFVEFLEIEPWQVDWFILSQSVVFLSLALPLSWITIRIGFRNTYIIMTVSLLLGFTLTAVGLSNRKGFPFVIAGQSIMGFSNIISWSIPPPTAVIWFPTKEVATAVSLQVVGRGVGESVGSILTPLVLDKHYPVEKIGKRFTWIFSTLSYISLILLVAVAAFVKDAPALPPSESQAHAIQENRSSRTNTQGTILGALEEYKTVIKELFTDCVFLSIWFAFGIANPVLRNNSVLLSSTLDEVFVDEPNLNVKGGLVLMGGWISYTVGGLVSGLLLKKYKKYKHFVVGAIGCECISTFVLMLGLRYDYIIFVYVAIVATGLSLGIANTYLYELILEVTYPQPSLLVTMTSILIMGVFRLLYPIIGRVILNNAAAFWSMILPFILLLISTITLLIIKPVYKRTEADTSESQPLLNNSTE